MKKRRTKGLTPRVIYSRRASKRQRSWIQNYYDQTGFDAMYQEDFDARRITFKELVRKNAEWFESHSIDVLHSVDRYPS